MRLLTDVDDCILAWLQTFIVYAEEKLGKYFPGVPTRFELSDFFEITIKEADAMVREFNSGHWRFGTLKPISDAQIYLPKLHAEGWEIIAITSSSSDEGATNLRKANLCNVFGDIFTDVHCVGLHETKVPELNMYEPSIWVEDKLSNALDGIKFGHTPYVFRRKHNEGDRDNMDVTWVDSWHEIYGMIRK